MVTIGGVDRSHISGPQSAADVWNLNRMDKAIDSSDLSSARSIDPLDLDRFWLTPSQLMEASVVEIWVPTSSIGSGRLILSAVADTDGQACCPTNLVGRLEPTLPVGNGSRLG